MRPLEQLVFSPLPEQDVLRAQPPLASREGELLVPGKASLLVGGGAAGGNGSVAAGSGAAGAAAAGAAAGSQAEVEVTFALRAATSPTMAGVIVMAGSDMLRSGTLFFFEYDPVSPSRARVGAVALALSSQYSRWMPHMTITCCAYNTTHEPNGPLACRAACDAEPKCQAWTYKAAAGKPPVCIRHDHVGDKFHPPGKEADSTCGAKSPSVTLGADVADLQLSAHDANVSLRVYVDHTLSEAFFQGGRQCFTEEVTPTAQASIAVLANASVKVASACVWGVQSIWVSPEEVLGLSKGVL